MQNHYHENQRRDYVKCTCKACKKLLATFMIKKDMDPALFEGLHEEYICGQGYQKSHEGKLVNLTIIIL